MKLTIRGFQSHDETALDITGSLVCVTGPNNVGKSAIIRAARWLMYDALRGSKFVKKGAPEARVEIEADGRTVVRAKSRKTSESNAYVVDGKTFSSIGTGAPPEVEEALGIRRAVIDKDLELELNVVRQKEHPFLMEETGTAKAKILNALTGLHVLDVAMRQTATALRSLGMQEKSLEEQVKSLKAESEGFADLPGKEAAVAAAREKLTALVAREEKARTGRMDLGSLAIARQNLEALLAYRQPDMASLDALMARLDTLAGKVSIGRSDLAAFRQASNSLSVLSQKKVADVPALEARLAQLEGLVERRTALADAISARKLLGLASASAGEAQGRLDCAMNELRSLAGSNCEACGQTLTEACLAEAA